MRCSQCGAENPEELKFCNQCAAPFTRPCAKSYTHTTVDSVTPGALVAKGPDRVSVIFGRQGDTVLSRASFIHRPISKLSDGLERGCQIPRRH
jgi:hypothetical protein